MVIHYTLLLRWRGIQCHHSFCFLWTPPPPNALCLNGWRWWKGGGGEPEGGGGWVVRGKEKGWNGGFGGYHLKTRNLTSSLRDVQIVACWGQIKRSAKVNFLRNDFTVTYTSASASTFLWGTSESYCWWGSGCPQTVRGGATSPAEPARDAAAWPGTSPSWLWGPPGPPQGTPSACAPAPGAIGSGGSQSAWSLTAAPKRRDN